MKRLTALLCCLLILFAVASAESDDSRSFLLHFTDTLPSALSGALSGSGYEDAVIADGYATMRFGRWSHIEMLLSQDGQYILAAGFYSSAENAWHITCSAKVLRQNGDMPSLLPAAVKYGQTSDYDISQYDGCDAFDITYADGTVYSWFCGSSGFFLSCVSAPGQDSFSLTATVVTNRNTLERCFNTYPVLLGEADISTLPTDYALLKAASDASPDGDLSLGVTNNRLYADMVVDGTPFIPLYADASQSAEITAYLFDDVRVAVLQEQDNMLQIRVGYMTGWVDSASVDRGSDRAASSGLGCPAMPYLYGTLSEQPIFAPDTTDVLSTAKPDTRLCIYAIAADDAFVMVHNPSDGAVGWMLQNAVRQTDNCASMLIVSDDASARLNLRRTPDRDSDSIGKYYAGTEVANLFSCRVADGWTYVGIEGICGWVMTKYLDYSSDASNGRMAPPLQKVTAKEATLFRNCMDDIPSLIIASYPKSTVVEVLGVSGNYAHVRLQDGQSGFIALKEIGGTPKMALPNEIKLTKATSRCQYDAATGEYVDDGTFSKGTTLVFNVRETTHWESVDGELVWTEVQYVYAYNKKNTDEYGYVSADLEWVP